MSMGHWDPSRTELDFDGAFTHLIVAFRAMEQHPEEYDEKTDMNGSAQLLGMCR